MPGSRTCGIDTELYTFIVAQYFVRNCIYASKCIYQGI